MSPAAADNPWEKAKAPAPLAAEAIGGYTAGCLAGAEELAKSSESHEVMRLGRRRNYGHPLLITYVRELAAYARALPGGGKLLVGDLAQARGGPTMSMHFSHQNGLDADIWYWLLPPGRKLRESDRERLNSPKVVSPGGRKGNRAWRPYMEELVRFTAARPEVERVLVNPAIKKMLCDSATGDRAFLTKVRPWWGHADHMHVRLSCPPGGADCEAQEKVTDGEDCGANLGWWWSKEAEEEFKKILARMEKPVMPVLPKRCESVIAAP